MNGEKWQPMPKSPACAWMSPPGDPAHFPTNSPDIFLHIIPMNLAGVFRIPPGKLNDLAGRRPTNGQGHSVRRPSLPVHLHQSVQKTAQGQKGKGHPRRGKGGRPGESGWGSRGRP